MSLAVKKAVSRGFSTLRKAPSNDRFQRPSFSFSGAGFLGCYHVGAWKCLLKHGLLLDPNEKQPCLVEQQKQPILTGVSAGAMIVAAISAGVTPEDAMNVVLDTARRTREQTGILDNFQPGFSLVDQMEGVFTTTMLKALGGSGESFDDYDSHLLMRRSLGGKLIRIGLTDKRKLQFSNFTDLTQLKNAYIYVDQFRNLQDLIAASILSCYIPLGTGPVNSEDQKNSAVKRATKRVKEMEQLGFVKCGITGRPLVEINSTSTQGKPSQLSAKQDNTCCYLDGGLVENWPIIDKNTVVITPINGNYDPNPYIAPYMQVDKLSLVLPPTVKASDRALVGINKDNLEAFARMLRSSDDQILEKYFQAGYDDARKFLEQNNMIQIHDVTVKTNL